MRLLGMVLRIERRHVGIGEGVAERMWLGFQAIDKASQLIAQNDGAERIRDALRSYAEAKGVPL